MKDLRVLLVLFSLAGVSGCGVNHTSTKLNATSSAAGDEHVLTCRSPEFRLNFYGAGASVQKVYSVDVESIVGRDASVPVTSMPCQENPTARTPGSSYTTHGCFDTKELDGGIYSVSLQVSAVGTRHAILERVTSRGARELAQMNCRSL